MKKTISLLLALIMIISALPLVSAASTSDLTFRLNDDWMSYCVSGCKKTAAGNLNIPSVYNGKPVTVIGEDAFNGCENITSVTIPESVTTIENLAFEFCTGISSIYIPSSVTEVGYGAFVGCISLEYIEVSPYNDFYSSQDGVLFNKDKTALIVYPGIKCGAYTVPGTVMYLFPFSFYFCTGLTSLTISANVTDIGDYALVFCTELSAVNVSLNNLYYSSENGVLFNKNKTKLICFPSRKNGSYTIPGTVNELSEGAFSFSSALTSVSLPNGLKTIGDNVFCYCESLTKITVPATVTSIGEGAFTGCTSLAAALIPSSVKTIAEDAFEDCDNLTIFGESGSFAQTYAKSFNIPFKKLLSSYSVKLGTVSNTSKGVKLSWSALPGAEKYIIYRKSVDSSAYSSIKPVSANTVSYTDTTAKSGTKYVYTVRASNEGGKSGYDKTGKTIFFLSAPTTKVVNNSGAVNVSWGKISGAKGYVIYKKTGSGSYKKLTTVKSGSTVSYKDKSVKNGTKYSYYVKSYNGSTYSGYKSGVSVVFISAPATKTATKNGYVSVSWNRIGNAKSYVIYRKAGSGSYKKLTTVKSGSTVSYSDKSVKSGTKYSYYVKAYNGSNYSGYKSSDTFLYLGTPAIKVLKKTNNQVFFGWNSVNGATSYQVQYRKSGNSSWNSKTFKNSNSAVATNFFGTYEWRIRAVNGKAKSAFSKTIKTSL